MMNVSSRLDQVHALYIRIYSYRVRGSAPALLNSYSNEVGTASDKESQDRLPSSPCSVVDYGIQRG